MGGDNKKSSGEDNKKSNGEDNKKNNGEDNKKRNSVVENSRKRSSVNGSKQKSNVENSRKPKSEDVEKKKADSRIKVVCLKTQETSCSGVLLLEVACLAAVVLDERRPLLGVSLKILLTNSSPPMLAMISLTARISLGPLLDNAKALVESL